MDHERGEGGPPKDCTSAGYRAHAARTRAHADRKGTQPTGTASRRRARVPSANAPTYSAAATSNSSR